ncbi:MAG: metal ABC transporter permease [Actinobacteria bacterium]|nr:metal ABC transporter permease [Actinomycetota bacterium]
MLKLAGGGSGADANLAEFIQQAWFIASVTILPTALVSIPFGAVLALQVGNLTKQIGAQSFTGAVAVRGFVREASPIVTALLIAGVVTALVAAVIGAVVIELVRARGRTSGDVALALMFYGGIAGGVLLIGLSSDGTNANLLAYLFGSLTSVSPSDVAVISVLSGVLLLTVLVVGREMFAVCHDEEYARVAGLPVRTLNLLLAVMAAVTVTVAMRVVGLLLVSALICVAGAIAAVALIRGRFAAEPGEHGLVPEPAAA